MSALPTDALTAGLSAIQADAGGVLMVTVVHPSEGPMLLASAMNGNKTAIRLFQAIVQSLEGIARAPRRRPMLCATCPRPLRKMSGFSIAVAMPERGDPSHGLCLAICARCANENQPNAVTAKAITALAKIWPDLKPVTVTHKTGGRA